jgi:hypothetical protein
MSSTGKRWFREMHVKGAREIVEAGEKLKSIKPHPVCSLYGGSRQPWSSGRSSRPRGGRMAGSSEPKGLHHVYSTRHWTRNSGHHDKKPSLLYHDNTKSFPRLVRREHPRRTQFAMRQRTLGHRAVDNFRTAVRMDRAKGSTRPPQRLACGSHMKRERNFATQMDANPYPAKQISF